MLTNIMYVTVYVTDQDRALKFYTEGLGLEKHVDYPGRDGRFLTVGVAGSPVKIILWSHAQASGQAVEPGTAPGPLILESDDLRKDFEVLRQRGVTFDEPPNRRTTRSAFASRQWIRTATGSRSASSAAETVPTADRL
jgi:catechol 2,3-dioxygenase-like lactoylglutathione lyase family enzyme